MIERHITLDRAMWGSDQAASVEPLGVMRIVRDARAIESALGDGKKVVYDSEIPVREKLRPRRRSMSLLKSRAADLQAALGQIGELDGALASAAAAVATSFRHGGKLLAAGNGGSAAEAQHLTGELVGRLVSTRERAPLPAIALHADTSSLTAVGNDYGYDQVFARQVEAIGRAGDVLLVLSTSGASANLVAAVEVANARGVVTVGLLGPGVKPLHERCTHVHAVDSPSMQVVQECHLLLLHVLTEQVEDLVAAANMPADL